MCTYCILCGSGVEEWRLQKQRRGTRGCTSPANGSSALPDEIIRRDLARAPSHASVSKSQKFVSLSLSLSLSLSGMSHPATHTIQVVKSSFAKLYKAAIKSTTSYYQRLDCWGRFELLVALSTNSIPLYYYCVYVANWHRLQFRRGLLRPTAPPSHVCCRLFIACTISPRSWSGMWKRIFPLARVRVRALACNMSIYSVKEGGVLLFLWQYITDKSLSGGRSQSTPIKVLHKTF